MELFSSLKYIDFPQHFFTCKNTGRNSTSIIVWKPHKNIWVFTIKNLLWWEATANEFFSQLFQCRVSSSFFYPVPAGKHHCQTNEGCYVLNRDNWKLNSWKFHFEKKNILVLFLRPLYYYYFLRSSWSLLKLILW